MAKKTKITNWQLKNKIYILRSCNKNFRAYNNFQWPKLQGWAETPIYVECPDWKPTKKCGNGLHGYAEGRDTGRFLIMNGFAQIVEVEKDEIVYIKDKCKFPRCNLLFCGSYKKATDFLVKQRYSHPIIGATIAVGNDKTVKVGNFGTAKAGKHGNAIAGDFGTASVKDYGTAKVGEYGTARAGVNGRIIIKYYDGNRFRLKVGYIGKNGLLPNVKYKLNIENKFRRAKPISKTRN